MKRGSTQLGSGWWPRPRGSHEMLPLPPCSGSCSTTSLGRMTSRRRFQWLHLFRSWLSLALDPTARAPSPWPSTSLQLSRTTRQSRTIPTCRSRSVPNSRLSPGITKRFSYFFCILIKGNQIDLELFKGQLMNWLLWKRLDSLGNFYKKRKRLELISMPIFQLTFITLINR